MFTECVSYKTLFCGPPNPPIIFPIHSPRYPNLILIPVFIRLSKVGRTKWKNVKKDIFKTIAL